MSIVPIRPRDRDAIMQALRAGVVPSLGLQHIQVGRVGEVGALLKNIDRVADGGSAVRFIIGDYGSGKTFFLYLIRAIALERRLVTVHADLTPDRRLHGTDGQARSLYQELIRNMATRARPDGNALSSVVERFISSAAEHAKASGVQTEPVIRERLVALSEMVGGYEFADVVAAYWRGYDTGDETLKASAVRWLRGEFSTRTDARNALGVRSIVDDEAIYDQLKLLARFAALAGFGGLLVCVDEMVNLYKLAHTKTRQTNYEQILRIVNDTLQGSAQNFGILFAGTPEFLMDPRRGLYSYTALQSRLSDNAFARDGLVDFSGPVIRLTNLTPEDLYVLLGKLRNVAAGGDPSHYLVPDEGLREFMAHCSKRIGDAYFRTPRASITAFLNLLAILEQNPGADWRDLLASVEVPPDSGAGAGKVSAEPDDAVSTPPPAGEKSGDDGLASFRL